MPRKRLNKSPPAAVERRSDDGDDEDFFFDDSQSNSSKGGQEPQQRNAANARERARMRVLSKAFCRLKTTLPWVPADTKLSKLDTLRLAASYIAHLRALLNDEPRPSSQRFSHPLNLAWPFAFQHGGSISCLTPRWNLNPSEDLNHDEKVPEYNKCRNDFQQQRRDFDHREPFADCQGHQVDEKRFHSNAVLAENYEPTVQYSSFDYRECYHEEIRNSY